MALRAVECGKASITKRYSIPKTRKPLLYTSLCSCLVLQIRSFAVYLCTNQYFDYIVMLTILVNCIFLAMTKPIDEAE